MKRLFDPNCQEVNNAPAKLRDRAIKEGLKLLQIVWDKEGGYLEHTWGFEQWSIRPYRLGYGCDGTTDENIHLIAWKICEQIGIDYLALYLEAYNDDLLNFDEWDTIAQETDMPKLGAQSDLVLRGILHDLNEINCRTVGDSLQDELERLGYNVDQWWNYREEKLT